MIDDLYDRRLAKVDFTLLLGGLVLLVGHDGLGFPILSPQVGGVMIGLGAVLFTANMLLVIRNHSPYSTVDLLIGRSADTAAGTPESNDPPP